MIDTLDAILTGFVLVLASMLAGGIIYIVIRDVVKRNIQKD